MAFAHASEQGVPWVEMSSAQGPSSDLQRPTRPPRQHDRQAQVLMWRALLEPTVCGALGRVVSHGRPWMHTLLLAPHSAMKVNGLSLPFSYLPVAAVSEHGCSHLACNQAMPAWSAP